MKKKIFTSLVVGLMLLGTAVTCLADTNGISRSISTTLSKASFTHYPNTGEGQLISVEQYYAEMDPKKGTIKEDTHGNTLVGMATTVKTQRYVTDGCQYLFIKWTKGFVNTTSTPYAQSDVKMVE